MEVFIKNREKTIATFTLSFGFPPTKTYYWDENPVYFETVSEKTF